MKEIHKYQNKPYELKVRETEIDKSIFKKEENKEEIDKIWHFIQEELPEVAEYVLFINETSGYIEGYVKENLKRFIIVLKPTEMTEELNGVVYRHKNKPIELQFIAPKDKDTVRDNLLKDSLNKKGINLDDLY